MIRHLFACLVTVSIALAVAVGGYAFLFVWAVFGGGGLGSPLTLPVLILVTIVCGIAGCLLVLMPSVALAERFTRRRLSELPMAAGLTLALCLLIARWMDVEILGGFSLWLLALLPLTGYWICVRSAGVVIDALLSALNWLRWRWTVRKLSLESDGLWSSLKSKVAGARS
jgi:hypothetical protein